MIRYSHRVEVGWGAIVAPTQVVGVTDAFRRRLISCRR